MKKVNGLFSAIILTIILLTTSCSHIKTSSPTSLDQNTVSSSKVVDQYRLAQRLFRKKDYPNAVREFESFIAKNMNSMDPAVRKRVFWSIDLVCRTYLTINKDPSKVIDFLGVLTKTLKFSDAEDDAIQEWIAVSAEWKKFGIKESKKRSKEDLFRLGEQYYRRGMDKISYPEDYVGNADFYIATTYLVPYVYNYDTAPNIGKALFMLGNIRYRSWNDYEYWTENFYLKEVISRFPHTKLAQKAYKNLELGIRDGYTGSGGDSTPPSQIKMLKQFKALADPK